MSTSHTITPVSVYVRTFLALLVFTALTVWAAHQEFGIFNTFVALAIAVTKASLVVIFFMGVRHNTPLTKVVAVAGFLWLLILFVMGMSDYLTRGWLGVPGR